MEAVVFGEFLGAEDADFGTVEHATLAVWFHRDVSGLPQDICRDRVPGLRRLRRRNGAGLPDRESLERLPSFVGQRGELELPRLVGRAGRVERRADLLPRRERRRRRIETE